MSVFKNGACMGKKDNIHGISGSIMSGKKCKNGTGIVKVIFRDGESQESDLFQEHNGALTQDDVHQVDDIAEVKLPEKGNLNVKPQTGKNPIMEELNLDNNTEDTSSLDLGNLIKITQTKYKGKPEKLIEAPYYKVLMKINQLYANK